MSNPFEDTFRAFGIPMKGDRKGAARPPQSPGPDPQTRAWDAVRRQVHGAASQPARSVWADYRPTAADLSPMPEEFRRRVARERSGGRDIFIGGGGDDLWWPGRGFGVMHDYAKDYERETGRPTRYIPNNRVDDVVEAIREGNATGGPVNVIGHSYAGPDAYNSAARARREGLHVDNLVTLDS
ncbi:MAG: hypothetical protein ABI655_04735, partial [Phenylobacterium sp.]